MFPPIAAPRLENPAEREAKQTTHDGPERESDRARESFLWKFQPHVNAAENHENQPCGNGVH
jgi:hypothetical protein